MSYTELEYGYQGLRKAARTPQFYVGGVSEFHYFFTNQILSTTSLLIIIFSYLITKTISNVYQLATKT